MLRASMNTAKNEIGLDQALASLDVAFRKRIIDSYLTTKKRFSKASFDDSWDASGLSVGKFCETVLRFLQFKLTGKYTPFGTNIGNFPDECRKLVQLPVANGSESLRILIPRALAFLNTLRGKRGIGHVGGDIEANEIDTAIAVKVCDWIISELIRQYHKLSLEEAYAVVKKIREQNIPLVWEVAGKKRILNSDATFLEKVLVLAYSELEDGILVEDLCEWSKHSNFSVFKRDVIANLDKRTLIEFDKTAGIVYISPTGIKKAEEILQRWNDSN